MTREEAVVVLKAFMENPLFSDVHKAAFNIAIHDIKQRHDWDINNLILINKDNYEPLDQEPTTKNDLAVDCIDRNYATRLLADIYHNSISDSSLKIYQIINWLNQLPSVIPQYSSELAKNSKKLEKDFGELDCISRQAVLDLIADYDLSMGQVVRGIHALPSVTSQESRKGHWISTETKGVRYAFWCRYKCSLCGGLSDRTTFCPNCGARMVAPQESEG